MHLWKLESGLLQPYNKKDITLRTLIAYCIISVCVLLIPLLFIVYWSITYCGGHQCHHMYIPSTAKLLFLQVHDDLGHSFIAHMILWSYIITNFVYYPTLLKRLSPPRPYLSTCYSQWGNTEELNQNILANKDFEMPFIQSGCNVYLLFTNMAIDNT